MTVSKLIFVSGNEFKVQEAKTILAEFGIEMRSSPMKIKELQIQDAIELVKDKALKAFGRLRQPLFVEHTGLYLTHLNGLPGGLTQNFWDSLQADRFSELFGNTKVTDVVARTHICYVDGYRFTVFDGEITGNIAQTPKGNRDFQWDCVFIPSGFQQTFSELGTDKKNEISMRKQALKKLAESVQGGALDV